MSERSKAGGFYLVSTMNPAVKTVLMEKTSLWLILCSSNLRPIGNAGRVSKMSTLKDTRDVMGYELIRLILLRKVPPIHPKTDATPELYN